MGICCMAQETQTTLYQPRGVGWGGRFKRDGIYIYGWFMLRFDRRQQNSVKQNLSIKIKKKNKKWNAEKKKKREREMKD